MIGALGSRAGGLGRLSWLSTVTALLLGVVPLTSLAMGTVPRGLDEAIRAQRALRQAAPEDVTVLNDLGNLLALAGERKEAEEVYREALALEPDNVSARYNLALLYQDAGRSRQARRAYKAVLKVDPDHAWSHYQLGRLLAEAGQRDKATSHYSRAFRLEPRLTLANVNPHILDNDLAVQAILTAYSRDYATGLAPRTYRDPARVRELLVPEMPALTEAAAAEEGRQESAASEGGAAQDVEPSGTTTVRPAPGAAAEAGELRERPPAPGVTTPEPRVRRPRRGRVVQGAAPTPAQPLTQPSAEAAPGEDTAQDRPEAPAPSEPVTDAGEAPPADSEAEVEAAEPPSPAEGEDEPDVFSTGRLELRLVPVPGGRAAATADQPPALR